jgi:hypothetical protein
MMMMIMNKLNFPTSKTQFNHSNRCTWLRIGTSVGACEHSYEPSVSINGGKFLD